jgi:lysophospholipase L1-like esterase
LADTRAYLPRLVLKHKPRLVVVYAGGNDLAANKSPAEICGDFQAIERALHAALPDCRLVYIGVKPTLRRLAIRDKEKELNDAIRASAAGKPRTLFIEADAPFCDAAGRPRADLLRDDKLHLNDAGYKVLNDLVRPVLAGP